MELSGVDLNTHLKAVVTELQHNESIYGYPKKKFYTGFPGIDLSVDFMGQAAATPLGPAAGPHTQLAQNIILSFLGGGRIMELKTVQILDQLEIPRPCIDIPNIGFNVEWSQELSLEAAYQEYVVAWILLHIIEEMELLDVPKGSPFYNTVFDLSVGYDLKGIQTGRVTGWINQMKDSSHEIRKQLEALPHEFSRFKSLKIDPHIGKSVTLSTFHGCPPGEIESIVEYFLKELNLHVNVKMNPTLLGYDFVERTLRQQLGYDNIELDPEAFEKDLHFDDGVAMMKRLEKLARERGLRLGAKFTNTLVVKNNKDVFKDELMYLSGPPLHVISMNTMHRFRKEMSPGFSISFSAGLNKKNFADSAACNLVPMTVCSDLLKNGGFTRMKVYLDNLSKAMNSVGAVNMAEYIQKKGLNQARNLNDDLHEATMANCETLIPNLVDDPQYHQQQNSKPPRKIDSQLEFYDCLTCNICLAVCPNAANISIPIQPATYSFTNYRAGENGLEAAGKETLELTKKAQIGNLADFCNECGDCDTYCPEHGGPFIQKPRFFFSRQTYDEAPGHDGFYFPAEDRMVGRIQGKEYRLQRLSENGEYAWGGPEVELRLDENGQLLEEKQSLSLKAGTEINLRPFFMMKPILDTMIREPHTYAPVLLFHTEGGTFGI